MAEIKQIIESVKKDLKPNVTIKDFKSVLDQIQKNASFKKIDVKAVFGGSIAKGTHIANDFDCDIFLKFSKKYKTEELSDLTEKIIGQFKPDRIHGSRDYFQFNYNKVKFEIVPVFNIKKTSELVNTTDASPLHAEWVKKELKKNPKLAEEIRLTKQFCKACGVYGAESFIRGFSGHVVDILTIYHKGFLKLLCATKTWKKKQVIDFYNIHKGNALFNLNNSKIISPLVVVDPIEPNRNAAASLSDEKFDIFLKSAKDFLAKPNKSFFIKKEISIIDLKKRAGKNVLVLAQATPTENKEDVAGTKLLKAFLYCQTQLKLHDFELIDFGWHWDRKNNALFWFISNELEKEKIWMGPPIKNGAAVKSFKQVHTNVFEKEGRIYAKVLRKFTDPKKYVETLFRDSEIKERVKKIKLIN